MLCWPTLRDTGIFVNEICTLRLFRGRAVDPLYKLAHICRALANGRIAKVQLQSASKNPNTFTRTHRMQSSSKVNATRSHSNWRFIIKCVLAIPCAAKQMHALCNMCVKQINCITLNCEFYRYFYSLLILRNEIDTLRNNSFRA